MSEEETQPLFGKKGKMYLLITAGFVGTVLGTMTLYNIVTRANHEEPPPSLNTQQPTSSKRTQRGEDLSALIEKRSEERQQSNRPNENAPPSQSTSLYPTATPQLLDKLTPTNQLETAKLKFEVAELNRAMLAAQSKWGVRPIKGKPFTPVRSSVSEPQTLEQRRSMVQNRINEATALQRRIANGDLTSIDGLPSQQLETIKNRFTLPPTNIVGYSASNSYNASVDGKYKLPIGTIVPAITTMTTMSDYAGTLTGMTTQDILDIDAENVLIPKGSTVHMKSVRISNVNEPIQARMGLTVPWVILPNGKKIDFSKSTGLDREGIAAIKDDVDRHLMAQFLGVAAYAVLGSSSSYDGSGNNSDQTFVGNVSDSARTQFAPLAQKYLSLTPTVTIKAGQSINIILEDEIYLDAWRNIYEDYQS